MTKHAELIKAALRIELEKNGHTLEEFENILHQPDSVKLASNLWDPTKIFDIGKGFLNAGGLSAGIVGGLGGYGAYKAYRGVQDTDEQTAKRMQEKQQYEEATHRLLLAQQASKAGIF